MGKRIDPDQTCSGTRSKSHVKLQQRHLTQTQFKTNTNFNLYANFNVSLASPLLRYLTQTVTGTSFKESERDVEFTQRLAALAPSLGLIKVNKKYKPQVPVKTHKSSFLLRIQSATRKHTTTIQICCAAGHVTRTRSAIGWARMTKHRVGLWVLQSGEIKPISVKPISV